MPKCSSCGKKGLFLTIDSNGLCEDCARKIRMNQKQMERNNPNKKINTFTINVCQTDRAGNEIYERICVDATFCKYYWKQNNRNITENDLIATANASHDFETFTDMIQNVLRNGIETSDEFVVPDRSSSIAKTKGMMTIVFDDGTEKTISLFNTTKDGEGVFGIYVYWARTCQSLYDMMK